MFRIISLLLYVAICNSQTLENVDLGSCSLSCNQEINRPHTPSGFLGQGRPGKRGAKGDLGLKGAKGEPCQCVLQSAEEVQRIRNEMKMLRSQAQRDCPQTRHVFPRSNQITDYVHVKAPIEDMSSFSICAWLTPHGGQRLQGSFVSYNTATADNVLVIIFTNKLDVHQHGTGSPRSFSIQITQRTHLCVVTSRQRRWVKAYVNGRLLATENINSDESLVGGGEMLIGQEQDTLLGSFAPSQALSGTVENFMMWNRQLGEYEIRSMYNDMCSCAKYHTVALTSDAVQLVGNVQDQLPKSNC